jgi:hypothetical protein
VLSQVRAEHLAQVAGSDGYAQAAQQIARVFEVVARARLSNDRE